MRTAHEPHPGPGTGHVPLVAEALGLLGGALVVIAGVVAASRSWDRLSPGYRLTLLGGVAALLLVAGRAVNRPGEPGLARLGSFLWLLATGTAAFWAGVLVTDVVGWRGADVVLSAGAGALAVAVPLWTWRAAPLQHAATFGALAVTAGGTAAQIGHVGGRFIGTALWALGVLWVVLAGLDLVRPAPLGYALGAALAVGGGMVLGGEGPWGDPLVILTALGLVLASVPARSMVLLWAGVGGIFVSVPVAINRHFGGSLGVPAVLLAAGVALVAAAVVAARLTGRVRSAPPNHLAPRTVAAGVVAAVVVVVGLVAGLTRITGVPSFPSLRTAPDPGIAGSVAYVRFEQDRNCVYVTAASGAGPARRLLCGSDISGGPWDLYWNAAGRLVVNSYGPTGPRYTEIDTLDGRVVSGGTAGEPDKASMAERSRAADGTVADVDSRLRGRPAVVLRSPSGATRTVFSAAGPRDYAFNAVIWSPAGRYLAVLDSEQRLLMVDTAATPVSARLLVTDAGFPAWSR